MKVLITNGSDPQTWYFEQQGSLLDVIRVIDTHYYVPDVIGTWGRAVRKEDGVLLYTATEYMQLQQKCEILKHDNDALFRDYRNLKEARIVQLPREVVHAINRLTLWGDDKAAIVFNAFRIKQTSKEGETVRDFAADNFEKFLGALVNGFIEEKP